MVSEFHLYKSVTELFTDYIIFPPSTVRNVDFLIVKDAVLLEVKSSVLGIYSATKQLINIASIAKIYNVPLIAITLPPEYPGEGVPPVLYFFRTLEDYRIKRKELWFLDLRGPRIHRLVPVGQEPIKVSLKCASQISIISIERGHILKVIKEIIG